MLRANQVVPRVLFFFSVINLKPLTTTFHCHLPLPYTHHTQVKLFLSSFRSCLLARVLRRMSWGSRFFYRLTFLCCCCQHGPTGSYPCWQNKHSLTRGARSCCSRLQDNSVVGTVSDILKLSYHIFRAADLTHLLAAAGQNVPELLRILSASEPSLLQPTLSSDNPRHFFS